MYRDARAREPNMCPIAHSAADGVSYHSGAYLKAVSSDTQIVGCWPRHSPVMYECLRAGRVIDVPERPTLSESTAGGLEADSVTLRLCNDFVDQSVLVSEAEIADAIRLILATEHWLIEGAAPVAAFRKDARHWHGKRVAIILCGRMSRRRCWRRWCRRLAGEGWGTGRGILKMLEV